MKVSLVWLGLISIGIILIFLGFQGFHVYEQFTNQGLKEGFQSGSGITSDLQLTSCPADSKSYVDNNGRTVCCQGSVENGKCLGRAICTLSEGAKDLPTCNTWYGALLEERGRDRCPASMPTYFEGGNLGRGCTAGRRNKTGTAPDLANAKFCKMYTTEKDELLKEDSCTNQKMLEQAQCPVPNAKPRFIKFSTEIPPVIQCEFITSSGLPGACFEDKNYIQLMEWAEKNGYRVSPNWKMDMGNHEKIQFCRIHKMVNIDKTVSYEDLKYVSVDPNSGPAVIPTFQLNKANKSRLQNKATKLCWDVWQGGSQNEAPIVNWDCHGGANQQYTFDSKQRLVIGHTGKCVDLSYGKNIVQYDCHDGANQKWYSDGEGRIRSPASDKCITAPREKGIPMTVQPCTSSENQKFQMA